MKTQLAVLLCAVTFQACAGITINATRVVYSGKEKVASLNIHNRSSTPYKVQIWLDAGLNTSRIGLPIVATPPQVYYRRNNPPSCALSISAAGCPAIGKRVLGQYPRRRLPQPSARIRCNLSSVPA
ncbi:gram-negative pili assembly chaperone protein [Klebsiella pneumoniae]|uniref:Gram-negative pili assembly chaperone protein n=1 Tax=Klebsiella pneumoniae TaxID=573 RepID=A0A377XQF4_KLEPN|nr:gram-negative pili assembly chaperone protein [Klebsiella pneumoniae]